MSMCDRDRVASSMDRVANSVLIKTVVTTEKDLIQSKTGDRLRPKFQETQYRCIPPQQVEPSILSQRSTIDGSPRNHAVVEKDTGKGPFDNVGVHNSVQNGIVHSGPIRDSKSTPVILINKATSSEETKVSPTSTQISWPSSRVQPSPRPALSPNFNFVPHVAATPVAGAPYIVSGGPIAVSHAASPPYSDLNGFHNKPATPYPAYPTQGVVYASEPMVGAGGLRYSSPRPFAYTYTAAPWPNTPH